MTNGEWRRMVEKGLVESWSWKEACGHQFGGKRGGVYKFSGTGLVDKSSVDNMLVDKRLVDKRFVDNYKWTNKMANNCW